MIPVYPEIMHTTRRWATAGDFPQPKGKGPNGRRFCRMCHLEVPKGRRTFCGEDCLGLYWIRVSGVEVRQQVLQRDRGICVRCGMDGEKLVRILNWATKHHLDMMWKTTLRLWDPMFSVQGELGMGGHAGTCWQPDHILPVAEGGGMCGLSNYRTLCSPCHLDVTKVQRRRMAKTSRLGRRAQSHQGAMQQKWEFAT